MAATACLVAMKTLMGLAIPPPPILQLMALAAIAVAGAPTQAAVMSPSPLQLAAPMVGPLAQALVARVQGLVATTDITPPGYVLIWEDQQPAPS